MWSGCRPLRYLFAQAAADAAAAYASHHQLADTSSHGPRWKDDTAAEEEALRQHHASAAYRELHQPALTTSAMGLYGGEPGFEKAYRVWVDPDRPHMKHVYNQTPLSRNLRYARYGYFKRDMHLLDVDKLIRHARLLPTPNRLLTDFLYQRVALPDRSCAALLRYQCSQITALEEWRKAASFRCAEEMFERLVATSLPLADVGSRSHAAMIRCCAAAGEWAKGWEVYRIRALELEEASQAMESGSFELDSDFFDALLLLCVSCGKPREGLEAMMTAVQRNLRPTPEMLSKALLLAALGMEEASNTGKEQQQHSGSSVGEYQRAGEELWALFDFYLVSRSPAAVSAYLRFLSAWQHPAIHVVKEVICVAEAATSSPPSLEAYQYALYALRESVEEGDYILHLFASLSRRGMQADHKLFTIAFMHAAAHRDGELAITLLEQHWLAAQTNPTGEMALAFIQACAQCPAPTVGMLQHAERLVEAVERVGSPHYQPALVYDALVELAAHLGAVGTAFGKVKVLATYGQTGFITTRLCNSLLLANANAGKCGGGSLRLTEEVALLFNLFRLSANKDTATLVDDCVELYGSSDALVNWWVSQQEQQQESEEQEGDEDLKVATQYAPHLLRGMRVDWHVDPRDVMLRRLGQHTKPPRSPQVGSMLGSVVPFGRTPGEQSV